MTTAAEITIYFTTRYMMPLPPGIEPLPAMLHPAPWLHITDVSAFVGLHLARLDSDSPLLRRIAAKNLYALHQKLTQPSTT